MFRKTVQRCVASLLVAIMLGGAFAPLSVSAKPSSAEGNTVEELLEELQADSENIAVQEFFSSYYTDKNNWESRRNSLFTILRDQEAVGLYYSKANDSVQIITASNIQSLVADANKNDNWTAFINKDYSFIYTLKPFYEEIQEKKSITEQAARDENKVYQDLLNAYIAHTDYSITGSNLTDASVFTPPKISGKDFVKASIFRNSPLEMFGNDGSYLSADAKIRNFYNFNAQPLEILGTHNDPIPHSIPSNVTATKPNQVELDWWGTNDASLTTFQNMASYINNDTSFPSFSSGGSNDVNPWTLIDDFLTVGATGAVHNKITQANIGYYTLMAYYALMNPDTVKEEDVEALYNNLAMDYNYSYFEMMNHMGYDLFINGSDFVNDANFMYSEEVLGDALASLDDNETRKYARALLFKCFEVFYSDVILMRQAEKNNDLTDPVFRNVMVAAKNYYDAFHEAFPVISIIYEYKANNSKYSLATCINELGITGDERAALDEIHLSGFLSWNERVVDDTTTPIGNFYSIRGDVSITSINKEMLWNDIQVNDIFDNQVIEFIENEKRGTLMMDPLTNEVTDREGFLQRIQQNAENMWSRLSSGISESDDQQEEIQDGVSSSWMDVTMSSYIMLGMKYSSNYIPMRTNVTDPILLSTYDDDFYRNFYKKYGFMRKALLKDTSGTAAVDLYNNNGVFAGNLEVCTLRDFIELGDNDLVLYIDPGFYNAESAISTGNTLINNHLLKYKSLAEDLRNIIDTCQTFPVNEDSGFFINFLNGIAALLLSVQVTETADGVSMDMTKGQYFDLVRETMYDRYKYNLPESYFSLSDIAKEARDIESANLSSESAVFTKELLKDDGYTSYSPETAGSITELPNSGYIDLGASDLTYDNFDSIVLPSSLIKGYMNASRQYLSRVSDGETITINTYDVETGYTPMMSLSYVSLLYRTARYYTLASAVLSNNPVFIASDDLCGVQQSISADGTKQSNQWWRNSLLNYALVRNLKANVQVDYTYCVDLDNPVYMDIFGNILTESGIVVIPAASNATLHTAAYKEYNVSLGLYSVYGKEYRVPVSLTGAYSVLHPWFEPDIDMGVYKVTAAKVRSGMTAIQLDNLSESSDEVKTTVQKIYEKATIRTGGSTRVNWYAMVNIANEVMRGAPIDNIDKVQENLLGAQKTTSALIAAAKYESLLESLSQSGLNTMLAIPDFSSMDNTEYFVALMIKIMMAVTAAVCIVFVYRDGVSGNLGWHTFLSVGGAVLLTFSCIVVVPAVFNLTYYGANKLLLEDEATRILLINEEKRQSGIEIGVTKVNTELPDDMFRIQLDWIQVPWYEQLNHVLYGSAIQTVDDVKQEAYDKSPITKNDDIIAQDNGVFITTSSLFDSVGIDYTWRGTVSGRKGLYMWDTNTDQTASFYSPYYVFLTSLTGAINEYNESINTYSYTVKAQSGFRKKTVGLCYNYFMSEEFLYNQEDILRLRQVYMWSDSDLSIINQDDTETVQLAQRLDRRYIAAETQRYLAEVESATNRALLFKEEDREKFRTSLWYNTGALRDIDRRIEVMDEYARTFIADNHDLLTKVTDETFIKVMALNLALKYNQLFGIDAANSLEINNLDSLDLLRLCTIDSDEAALSISMSFPRFVYNYGGEASVYAAAILSMVLWVGSFVKPLCTVIVFISVFLSIWVFRVVLRKPSANLWGYLITILLLCGTNIAHALLLKASLFLPKAGLPMLGCFIFIIVGQVAYLLILAYVTGVSLKDWSNLGYNEYQKEAQHLKAKFKKDNPNDYLSGQVPHHDKNWDYYDDLVNRHRSRNSSLGASPQRMERITSRDYTNDETFTSYEQTTMDYESMNPAGSNRRRRR